MLSNTQTGTSREKNNAFQRGGNSTSKVSAAATATNSSRNRKSSSVAAGDSQDSRPGTVASTPTHDEIVARAVQIYVKKGRPEGRDLENWLEAEMELHRERGMTMAKK